MKKLTLILVFTLFAVSTVYSQYQLDQVFTSSTFNKPLEMAEPEDGTNRLFIVGQTGNIYVLNLNTPGAPAKVFINISDLVPQSGLEPGLLGIAFHPNYENNRYFYLHYTMVSPIRNVISRFTASSTNPDSALRSSQQVIFVDTISTASHFGGKIAFGPDNLLYISLGMGTGQNDPPNNAQNLTLLRGKILRINVDSSSGGLNYSIPSSNPFVDSTGGQRKEIFAWGFRNLWKFNFDPQGRMWGADVGQISYEEIDIIEKGRNYGWRIMEGFSCFNPNPCDTTGLAKPVFAYGRTDGLSVTGGYVSTSPALPSIMNKYLYSDWGNGKIWALTYTGTIPATSELLTSLGSSGVSSFGMDKNKNIYISNVSTGKIYLLRDLTVSITNTQQGIPGEYSLRQNYPNPFNPSTVIGFSLIKSGNAKLRIFNAQGKEVTILTDKYFEAGSYELSWNASSFAAGIYFYRLETNEFTETKRLVLLK
jgi:glucose/arabinose dehydrogenase